MPGVDDFDRKLLNLLIEKGSLRYKDAAKKMGTTMGTVHNRMKALEREKILRGFIPAIDHGKLGYDIAAIINVNIKGGHLEEIEKKYSSHKNVCCVYDVTGEADCAIIAKFKRTGDLNKFVKKLMAEPFVERTTTNLVLEIVKENLNPFPVE
ncbi:MAG: Lrp/AsnC family transcriptional regulator [Candidatus Diapherotrites archaeon]